MWTLYVVAPQLLSNEMPYQDILDGSWRPHFSDCTNVVLPRETLTGSGASPNQQLPLRRNRCCLFRLLQLLGGPECDLPARLDSRAAPVPGFLPSEKADSELTRCRGQSVILTLFLRYLITSV
jgi:hypothetical protein